MSEVQRGDLVRLKSGGPRMTVKFVEREEAACSWFDGLKVVEHRFDVESLEAAADAPSGMRSLTRS